MKVIITIFLEIAFLVALIFIYYSDYIDTEYLEKYDSIVTFVKFLGYFVAIGVIKQIMQLSLPSQRKRDFLNRDNLYYGINNIAKLLVGIGFVVTVFAIAGIDVRTLLTSLSIVAAAIAIISKEYINDFIVGLYFSFSGHFGINDYVQIGEHKGKIQQIEMLKIKLLNDDDDLVIIPNGKIYSNEIINFTKRDIRLMSVDFQLDIRSVNDVEKLEEELILALADLDDFIDKETYNLKIVEVKKDYIGCKFQYTLKEIDRDLQRKVRKTTVRKIFSHISSRIEE